MLDNIRKTADSFVMRVLFAMIAFAFVGFGIKDVLHGRRGGNIVTFSHAKNISQEDFLRAKSQEINAISKQTGANLTDEEIAQLNIDSRVLRRLVYDNILDYLVSYYDLDLSDDTVKTLVKESPVFKNEQGVFDIKIFKTYFRNSYIDEEKYLVNFKEKALKNILVGTFLRSFYVPKVMTKNIVDYMAEKREVELVQVNLQNKTKDMKIPVPSEQESNNFYQNNKSSFEILEKRSFSYIKITTENLQKKIQITRDEVVEFYNENKDEFGEQSFEAMEKQLYDILQAQKIDVLNMELAKNLEDDVAAGSSLVEIAEKYKLPINNINGISYAELVDDKIIAENANSIFELSEGELSYPIEAEDKSYLVLVELKSVQPAKIPEFDSIKDQVEAALIKQNIADLNLKIIKDLAKEYSPENIKDLKAQNIKVSRKNYIRADMENDLTLTPEILLSIFNTKIGSNTPVFQVGSEVYFAHIKSAGIDDLTAKNIQTNSEKNIIATIQNSVADELINYTIRQNDMKIQAMPQNSNASE
ncbi:MAG: SurA N-terminal domain-containing protein [Rickettsia endosymbiont of Pentastiridius leporinus]